MNVPTCQGIPHHHVRHACSLMSWSWTFQPSLRSTGSVIAGAVWPLRVVEASHIIDKEVRTDDDRGTAWTGSRSDPRRGS